MSVLNRSQLQAISEVRENDARVLFENGQHQGAFYLVGYSVECALKACIAKQVRRYDFPDRNLANRVYTHDLELLLKSAGLAIKFANSLKRDESLRLSWAIVKDWSETSRYNVTIGEAEARDLLAASTEVLEWIRRRW